MLAMGDTSNIRDYLQQVIGIEVEVRATGNTELANMPLFLRNAYEYQRVSILDKDVVFAIVRVTDTPSPDQLKKQEEQLERMFAANIVFVFEWLEAYQRKRLVQKRLPFMVPGKQLYIPFLFIDLNEMLGKPKKQYERLRPASQCLLLYHLQVEQLEGLRFQDIALRLRYSSMTISRAAKELEAFGLVEIAGSREKNLKFNKTRKGLWQQSKELFLSPVKERVYVSQLPGEVDLYASDQTGLEHYTDLAGGWRQTYALDDDTYRLLKRNNKLKDLNVADGKYSFEVWSYKPGLLTDTNVVDPLSLYLSMREAEDERVEIALEQLLEQVVW